MNKMDSGSSFGIALVISTFFVSLYAGVCAWNTPKTPNESMIEFFAELMNTKKTGRFNYKTNFFKFSDSQLKKNNEENNKQIFEFSMSLIEDLGCNSPTKQDHLFFKSINRFCDKEYMKKLGIFMVEYVFEKEASGYYLYVKFIKL